MNLGARWCWATAAGAVPVAWLLARLGHGMPTAQPLRDVALLVLLAVAEEVVFRGGVQPFLLRHHLFAPRAPRTTVPRFAGVSAANALTSVLFAAAHLWAHPPLAALGVLPVSLLGAAYEHSGERLAPPIALHLYFNLLLYACSFALTRA